jgi:hypothetical protein
MDRSPYECPKCDVVDALVSPEAERISGEPMCAACFEDWLDEQEEEADDEDYD